VNARSRSPLLAALALVAFAASARAEAPVVVPAHPAPVVAPLDVAPLPGASLPAVAAPEPESPAPLVDAPAKAARVPLAKRWWFWAGLGTAAVGVVLAAIFIRPRDPYNGNAMPGTVTLF
jgi:hypothetical protein